MLGRLSTLGSFMVCYVLMLSTTVSVSKSRLQGTRSGNAALLLHSSDIDWRCIYSRLHGFGAYRGIVYRCVRDE